MNRNDILWSERRSEGILEDIFPDFLTFFISDAPEQIDFLRGFEFLDKELEQLERQPGFPPNEDVFKPRHIDKLVKVFTRQGSIGGRIGSKRESIFCGHTHSIGGFEKEAS